MLWVDVGSSTSLEASCLAQAWAWGPSSRSSWGGWQRREDNSFNVISARSGTPVPTDRLPPQNLSYRIITDGLSLLQGNGFPSQKGARWPPPRSLGIDK